MKEEREAQAEADRLEAERLAQVEAEAREAERTTKRRTVKARLLTSQDR